MGFGLLALGYIFLNFYTTGADLIGYVIMLIALHKLTKIEKSFKKSLIAVIILIPVGMFNLFGFIDTALHLGYFRNYDYTLPTISVDSSIAEESLLEETSNASSENSELSKEEKAEDIVKDNESEAQSKKTVKILEGIFNAIFIFGSLCFHYFFYQSARKLCLKTDALKLGMKAYRNMAVNIVFFSVWGLFTAGGISMAALNVITILHFAVLIFNFIYIYTCYATFAVEGESENEDVEE